MNLTLDFVLHPASRNESLTKPAGAGHLADLYLLLHRRVLLPLPPDICRSEITQPHVTGPYQQAVLTKYSYCTTRRPWPTEPTSRLQKEGNIGPYLCDLHTLPPRGSSNNRERHRERVHRKREPASSHWLRKQGLMARHSALSSALVRGTTSSRPRRTLCRAYLVSACTMMEKGS